jgi:hypothetical protein
MTDTKKDVYVEKIKAKLDEWSAEIDRLDAKSRQQQAEAKKAYLEQINELKKKRASAQVRLQKLQNAGAAAWEDLKVGVEEAINSVGEALQSARARF